MKKFFCLVVITSLLLGLCACGAGAGEGAGEGVTTAEAAEEQEILQINEQERDALTQPADYEIYKGLAKTLSHYYIAKYGGIVRVPIADLAKQESVPLPEHHEDMELSGAEICGITEKWLFVNRENKESRTIVTCRIAMETWKTDIISANTSGDPWYHPASDSLLIRHDGTIPQETDDGRYWIQTLIDVIPLSTGVRRTIEWVGDQSYSGWQNTLDGCAVLSSGYDDDGPSDYPSSGTVLVFDSENQAKAVEANTLRFARHIGWWGKTEAPKNEAERRLYEKEDILTYATCGDYVYYTEQQETEEFSFDLFRIKMDNSEKKLLRKDTNISRLCSVGGRLFAEGENPTVILDYCDGLYDIEIGIYLLNSEGNVEETLHRFWSDNQTGNSSDFMVPYGDQLMVMRWELYSEPLILFLYDPATGAVFTAQTLDTPEE